MDKDLQIKILLKNIKSGYQNGMYAIISLNQYFGYVKEDEDGFLKKFVDGYMQVQFDYDKYGTESKYYHNYVTTNGKLVFADSFRGAYIGRNIFLCIDDHDNYCICTPDKGKRYISFPYALLNSSIDDLIEKIVKELNIKYLQEANGMKYKPSKQDKKEWMLKTICGMEVNTRKTILRFVDAISAYDDMPRYNYE